MKRAVVLGAAGFIGSHLTKRLKDDGYWVRALSRRKLRGIETIADEFWPCDLRMPNYQFFDDVDEVYHLAGEVGGLGYIARDSNAWEILRNSTQLDLNVIEACLTMEVPRLFFCSSACVYPSKYLAMREEDALPAQPSNPFAWQKIYAEQMYKAFAATSRTQVRIGRLFNTYGPGMTFEGGREKSVAAICRKIALAKDFDTIFLWGSGHQQRSYTYVDDAVEGILRLTRSNYTEPLNIGNGDAIRILDLALLAARISGKQVHIAFEPGPVGVERIICDPVKMEEVLNWRPQTGIEEGLLRSYRWLAPLLDAKRNVA